MEVGIWVMHTGGDSVGMRVSMKVLLLTMVHRLLALFIIRVINKYVNHNYININ